MKSVRQSTEHVRQSHTGLDYYEETVQKLGLDPRKPPKGRSRHREVLIGDGLKVESKSTPAALTFYGQERQDP